MRLALMAVGLCLVGCGTARSTSEDENLGVVGGVDTSREGLVKFSKATSYSTWLKEPLVHKSAGPHGQVRTYFNDTLMNSLKVGAKVHPVGSISVKELYQDDGATLAGHAVMVKVSEGADKDSWLYFEGFAPEYQDPYYGRGHQSCHGCHAAGKDYVTTALP